MRRLTIRPIELGQSFLPSTPSCDMHLTGSEHVIGAAALLLLRSTRPAHHIIAQTQHKWQYKLYIPPPPQRERVVPGKRLGASTGLAASSSQLARNELVLELATARGQWSSGLSGSQGQTAGGKGVGVGVLLESNGFKITPSREREASEEVGGRLADRNRQEEERSKET